MAEVSGTLPEAKNSQSYFPAIPPKAPKATIAYSVAQNEAPYTALMGILPDEKVPGKLSVSPRCRIRNQTGTTNRWRLPECLYSDILGTNQAIRAITMPYNQGLINIITAEGSKLTTNMDLSKPYTFRASDDRSRSFDAVIETSHIPAASPEPNRPKSMSHAYPIKTYVPHSARPSTAKDLFLFHSLRKLNIMGPDSMPGDVLLHCLSMDWELHSHYLQKSETLANLLRKALDTTPHKSYRNATCETLDNFVNQSPFYSSEYRELSNRFTKEVRIPAMQSKIRKLDSSALEKKGRQLTKITLHIEDPFVTQTALAITLGHLYRDEFDVDLHELAGVFTAASILQFKPLVEWCVKNMLKTITFKTVCKYHQAASKCKRKCITAACERWLELNLIPQLASQIQLRELSCDLLQKIIKSNRLFVYNEYSLYKMLALWTFLQLNPHLQLMPSYSSLLAYFNSLPKTRAFVETDEGQEFLPLFAAVRFEGILDTSDIQDMKLMNILPQSWLVDLLSKHYHALQGGGDMAAVRISFDVAAVRKGFIIDDEPHYHSEILSIHGFHFELKAVKEAVGYYVFYMQRLEPTDPILTFKQSERHTFSLRRDRETRYSITVQFLDECAGFFSTGVKSKKFGLSERSNKSEVLELRYIKKPTYVSFAVLFPAS